MKDLIRANAALLFVGLASYVMMGAGQSLYGPALPAFGRALSLTPAQAGWLVSAHWVGCAIGVALMYLYGARATPRIAIGLMVLGAAALAMAAGLWITFAGAVVFGMGYGISTTVFNPRILRAFGARGTAMVSLLNASFGIGAIAAPLVFVGLGSNPALAFALITGFGALIWLGAGRSGGSAAPPPGTATGHFRPMLAFQLFAVAGIGIEATLVGLGPSALIRAGLAESSASQVLSAFFVAFLGARVALIFTAHLVAPFTLYIGAMMLAALSATLAALVNPGLFFVSLGLSAGLFFPGFYVAASRVMGDDPRTPAIIIAAGLVGGILAPILLSPVIAQFGGAVFFGVLAGVAALSAVCALIVRRTMPELLR